MEGFTISTDKNLLDIGCIHAYLSESSYWAQGRSIEKIEQSIRNSLCFGMYNAEGQQVGFARIVTDFAVFGYLMDVFILEDFRGKGLGKQLISTIITHPELQGLRKLMLATRDAHTLYSQFGFREVKDPENMMEFFF